MYDELLKYPNVIGAGLGIMTKRGERYSEGVVVMVSQKLPLAALRVQDVIPKEHHGVVTDVMQVGHVRALRTGKYRPAPGGVSIGHYMITAGTLGCVLYDVQTGNEVILSNNHVLACSNDGQPGDPIYQPGPYDGGTDKDKIAELLRFVKIDFGEQGGTCPLAGGVARVLNFFARGLGSTHQLKSVKTSQAVNKVDAAIAVPMDRKDVTRDILEMPSISDTATAGIGMGVCKSGRTTGYSESIVVVVNATITVSYGEGRQATFEDQFITGPLSQGGDSGSLVAMRDEPKAVGLLFAGSEQVTVCNRIENVFDALNLSF